MNDLSSFQNLYKETAKQNVQSLSSALQKLLGQLSDPEALELAHRSAHTLKSKSLVMGHLEIGNLAKEIEDTLYEVKNNRYALSQDKIQMLISSTKQIEVLILQL